MKQFFIQTICSAFIFSFSTILFAQELSSDNIDASEASTLLNNERPGNNPLERTGWSERF